MIASEPLSLRLFFFYFCFHAKHISTNTSKKKEKFYICYHIFFLSFHIFVCAYMCFQLLVLDFFPRQPCPPTVQKPI